MKTVAATSAGPSPPAPMGSRCETIRDPTPHRSAASGRHRHVRRPGVRCERERVTVATGVS